MDGIIIVNKPKGCTSHDVVSKVRRIVKEKTLFDTEFFPNNKSNHLINLCHYS